jgi:DNA-directed RNA polymerase specialized sigma24 family protein
MTVVRGAVSRGGKQSLGITVGQTGISGVLPGHRLGASPYIASPGSVPNPATAAESAADQVVTDMYATHYGPLVRLAALLVGDLPAAESIVQESFVGMHRNWSRLRDHDAALSFMRQSVVLGSRAWLRHPAATEPGTATCAPAQLGAGQPAAAGPAAPPAVMTAIRTLPPRQREALVLRFYLDLPDAQIAAAMRVSRAAVQGHAARGLAALQAAGPEALPPVQSPA